MTLLLTRMAILLLCRAISIRMLLSLVPRARLIISLRASRDNHAAVIPGLLHTGAGNTHTSHLLDHWLVSLSSLETNQWCMGSAWGQTEFQVNGCMESDRVSG